MRIDTRIANDLSSYFGHIDNLAEQAEKDGSHPAVLWFRGITGMEHSLIPSLFRTTTRVSRTNEMKGDYSSLHYAEDIRTQHYIAKNYHFFQNVPSSRVEWLEVMQHHSVKTRVLDWSESSVHSLLFAVENFLDGSKPGLQEANLTVPCVWVLEPAALNKKIFEFIKEKVEQKTGFSKEISDLFSELEYADDEMKAVRENIKHYSDLHMYAQTSETSHIDYIVNLSAINDEIMRDRPRLKYLLKHGDILNPYYYILSRIYSDGTILSERKLPPLAVVHPYHSERIKAQHGVFTVFPFYSEKDKDDECREMGINPDAMENNAIAGSVLHQIIITNPKKIAYELIHNGMDDSWLYPEMPVVSNAIESRRICI